MFDRFSCVTVRGIAVPADTVETLAWLGLEIMARPMDAIVDNFVYDEVFFGSGVLRAFDHLFRLRGGWLPIDRLCRRRSKRLSLDAGQAASHFTGGFLLDVGLVGSVDHLGCRYVCFVHCWGRRVLDLGLFLFIYSIRRVIVRQWSRFEYARHPQ